MSHEEFVRRLYRALLQREPDPEGLTNWVNHCYTYGRHFVLAGIANSDEFLKVCNNLGIYRGWMY
ncbi:MAG: DUF4214 domain-containing protein [Clostridiales bacterium]|nr:DUF4214 domain-containing protein [Clostridiales bacterium]